MSEWPEAAEPEPVLGWKVLIDLRYLIFVHLLSILGWLVAAFG
jgi:hypothetical protein